MFALTALLAALSRPVVASGGTNWTVLGGTYYDCRMDGHLRLDSDDYQLTPGAVDVRALEPMIQAGLGSAEGSGYWRVEYSALKYAVDVRATLEGNGPPREIGAHGRGELNYVDAVLGYELQRDARTTTQVYAGARLGWVDLLTLSTDGMAGAGSPPGMRMDSEVFYGLGVGSQVSLNFGVPGLDLYAAGSLYTLTRETNDVSRLQRGYSVEGGLRYGWAGESLGLGLRAAYRVQTIELKGDNLETQLDLDGPLGALYVFF